MEWLALCLLFVQTPPTQLGVNSMELADPDDPTPVSHFRLLGASVACSRYRIMGGISGYTLLVGAPGDDSMSTDGGAVHLYDSGVLATVMMDMIPLAPVASGDQAGQVAIDQNTLAVGAWRASGAMSETGVVQVFSRNTGTNKWSAAATFDETHFGAVAMDRFSAIDLQGEKLIVASRLADSGTGAAFVFDSAGMTWQNAAVTQLEPTMPVLSQGDQFGSVAIFGDIAAVGARRMDVASFVSGAAGCPQNVASCQHGAVFLFDKNATFLVLPWSQVDVVTAERQSGMGPVDDFGIGDEFGFSVALSEKFLVVGAPGKEANCDPITVAQESNCDTGAVYIYIKTGTDWVFRQRLFPSDSFAPGKGGTAAPGAENVFQRFGYSVAIHERRLVVGAPGTDSNQGNGSALGTGAVFAYELDNDDLWVPNRRLCEADLGIPSGESNPHLGTLGPFFGASVDIDCSIVAVGAPRASSLGRSFAGKAYVFNLLTEPDSSVYASLCDGDGPFAMGCGTCPCGNNSAAGALGGCTNSLGLQARLYACGEPSIASDTLRFELEGAGPGSLCVLVSGAKLFPAGAMAVCPSGSGLTQPAFLDGLNCVGAPLLRLGNRQADANGAVGATGRGWGGIDPPGVGLIELQLGMMPMVGSTRHYQVRYRDSVWSAGAGFSCGVGLNTTNAVSVVVAP